MLFWSVAPLEWQPSLTFPYDITLRAVSNYLLAAGAYRNTLDEVKRLNPDRHGADTVLSHYTPGGGIGLNIGVELWAWTRYDSGGGGSGSSSIMIEPYLRMTQRNDGGGIKRNPRLRASHDASTSVQTSVAPRLGRSRYR